MKCPTCHHNGTRVLDSRPVDEGKSIRRRRECEECQYRFTTFEKVEEIPLIVVKKKGSGKNSAKIRFFGGSSKRVKSALFLFRNWRRLCRILKKNSGIREYQK